MSVDQAKHKGREWLCLAICMSFLNILLLTKCRPAQNTTPALSPGDTQIRSADGMEMVYVPVGEFLMGSTDADKRADDDEKPQHIVYLDAYWIDKTEVTNAQYRRCVEAGVCQVPRVMEEHYWEEPSTYGDLSMAEHPVVHVNWNDARTYCEWAGVRLPTDAEWEKAARGTDGLLYPWGSTFDDRRLNFCDKRCVYSVGVEADDGYHRTAPVGNYPTGASPYGVLDMAGNAYEWVADWYDAEYYNRSPTRNPRGPDSGEYHVLRGGSWHGNARNTRTTNRAYGHPPSTNYEVGFRCASSRSPH